MLLEFGPASGSDVGTQGAATNPTQALIQAIDEYRKASAAVASTSSVGTAGNALPSRAKTAAQGILAGKSIKEEEYFLALIPEESGTAAGTTTVDRQVVRILSGDPARGAMSLEMEQPLRAGMRCQVSLSAGRSGEARAKRV